MEQDRTTQLQQAMESIGVNFAVKEEETKFTWSNLHVVVFRFFFSQKKIYLIHSFFKLNCKTFVSVLATLQCLEYEQHLLYYSLKDLVRVVLGSVTFPQEIYHLC